MLFCEHWDNLWRNCHEKLPFSGSSAPCPKWPFKEFHGFFMRNEDVITQSCRCLFESSFFLCKNGIKKPKVENLLFSLWAETWRVSSSDCQVLQSHDGCETFCLFFVCSFVSSQAAASGRGTRSGVHQRCQCQSLPGHEGGWQIAGLGKQPFPDVSVLLCPALLCVE